MNTAQLSRSINQQLRRLDYLPAWQAVLGGLVLGGGAAALFAGPSPFGAGLFLLLLAGSLVLAWTGEPIPLPDEPPASAAPVDDPLWAAIPAGSFVMGSTGSDREKPPHSVTISAFECLRTPVTRRLYREVMGSDPGWPEGDADERPVNNVSWFDAVEFCNGWSERLGLEPCYQRDGDHVTWDRTRDGVRLLTEAEWEYACRAGSTARWSFGDDEAELGEYAWFGANANDEPHAVGLKRPNAWGLYDLHGNVWEWVGDWYGDYTADAQTDPQGPSSGTARVLRGGAFGNEPRYLRSANRGRDEPEDGDWVIGFRCARAPRRQP